jgi:hypothetical protein
VIGHITDAERRGWQHRALRVLAELLNGSGRELPPLTWTVATRARLLGHVESHDPITGREHFEAWAQALHAEPRREWDSGLYRTLRAERKDYDGLVDVGVVADLDKPEDDQ